MELFVSESLLIKREKETASVSLRNITSSVLDNLYICPAKLLIQKVTTFRYSEQHCKETWKLFSVLELSHCETLGKSHLHLPLKIKPFNEGLQRSLQWCHNLRLNKIISIANLHIPSTFKQININDINNNPVSKTRFKRPKKSTHAVGSSKNTSFDYWHEGQ